MRNLWGTCRIVSKEDRFPPESPGGEKWGNVEFDICVDSNNLGNCFEGADRIETKRKSTKRLSGEASTVTTTEITIVT